MTYDDRQWIARQEQLLKPLWDRWIEPCGKGRWLWRWRVYVVLLQAHRWAWVRGVAL